MTHDAPPPTDREQPAAGPLAEAALSEFERALTLVMRLLMERGRLDDLALRAGHDLPRASWALLEHLNRLGALRVSDIAACHDVDVSSITPRVKALEADGLIVRRALPTDARVSLMDITPSGREALDRLHTAWREIVSEAVGGVDPGQVAIAAQVLAAMAMRLQPPASRPSHTRTGNDDR